VQMTSIHVRNLRKYSNLDLSWNMLNMSLGGDIEKARDAHDFGHHMYFVSQMFDEEWIPTLTAWVVAN
jgi:hypothetical protein